MEARRGWSDVVEEEAGGRRMTTWKVPTLSSLCETTEPPVCRGGVRVCWEISSCELLCGLCFVQ